MSQKKWPSLGTDEELADVMRRAKDRGFSALEVCWMLSIRGIAFVRGILDDADAEND